MNNPKFVRLSVKEDNVGVGDFHFILRFSGERPKLLRFSVIENQCDVGFDVWCAISVSIATFSVCFKAI